MRPTEIGLKIPANKTPASRVTAVNQFGDSTQMAKTGRGFSFSSQKRFDHYDRNAKHLSFLMGPGTHDLTGTCIGSVKSPKTPVYTAEFNSIGKPRGGLYYSGNLLVYDEKLMRTVKQNRLKPQLLLSRSSSGLPLDAKKGRCSVGSNATADTQYSNK